MQQIVWFFDQPTIGYCPDCKEIAIYHGGLVCPKCGKRNLAIFHWDPSSLDPEDGDE